MCCFICNFTCWFSWFSVGGSVLLHLWWPVGWLKFHLQWTDVHRPSRSALLVNFSLGVAVSVKTSWPVSGSTSICQTGITSTTQLGFSGLQFPLFLPIQSVTSIPCCSIDEHIQPVRVRIKQFTPGKGSIRWRPQRVGQHWIVYGRRQSSSRSKCKILELCWVPPVSQECATAKLIESCKSHVFFPYFG